jgi:phosphate acetyltransferase/phosphate butyryltransferase
VQNAIDLVNALRQSLNKDALELLRQMSNGDTLELLRQLPRVAILSAVETVTEKLKSTLDAAALCKMADRGQITGAILDGPLAFDNAVSEEAAKTKGIVSPVAGKADIFVVPDLEAGNMLAKQLEYLGDAGAAGIVLGARVPIILTSRADNTLTRLGSCAMAQLLVHHRQSTKVSAL